VIPEALSEVGRRSGMVLEVLIGGEMSLSGVSGVRSPSSDRGEIRGFCVAKSCSADMVGVVAQQENKREAGGGKAGGGSPTPFGGRLTEFSGLGA
jgi:hypothetical protein